MLSNAFFLAKIRFDTGENEPAKNFQKCNLLQILVILLNEAPAPTELAGSPLDALRWAESLDKAVAAVISGYPMQLV